MRLHQDKLWVDLSFLGAISEKAHFPLGFMDENSGFFSIHSKVKGLCFQFLGSVFVPFWFLTFGSLHSMSPMSARKNASLLQVHGGIAVRSCALWPFLSSLTRSALGLYFCSSMLCEPRFTILPLYNFTNGNRHLCLLFIVYGT